MPRNKLLAMCLVAGLAAVSTCPGFAHNSFSAKYVSFYGIPQRNRGVPAAIVQADLNGDGIPDVISLTDAGVQTLLSRGGGNYTVHEYAQFFITSVPLTAGDFNGDGKMDVFFYDFNGGSRIFFTAYGDGHGDFTSTTTAPNIPSVISGQQNYILARTTDINGDGRPDIVFAYFNENTRSVYVRPYLNNGQSFTDAGNVFSFKPPNGFIGSDTDFIHTPDLDFLLGDFDSDGHADFALRVLTGAPFPALTPDNNLFILYGDGAGRFTSKAVFTHRKTFVALSAADMNDDGRSDLVGGDTDESVHIFFSGAGRSFSEKAIPASAVQIPMLSYYPPILADFDGNGRKDIVFVAESSTDSSSIGVRGLYQLAGGSFSTGPYAEADTFTIDLGEMAFITFAGGDYNHDAKPDVAPFTNNRSANTHPNSADLMLNTGRNAVGACAAPGIGIHVCSPGSSSASPVHFSFSATSFSPIRKMEVWVDGVKKSETYHVFGYEGFSDVSLALSAGTHRVSFYSGGFDGTVTKQIGRAHV